MTKFRNGEGNPLKGQALADAIKRHGAEVFSAARADDPDWAPDLRNADLRRRILRGADLRWANLSLADLSGADLRNADLRNADLTGARMNHIILVNADLRDADLREAKLISADLSGAKLTGADLRWAKLSGADLRGANLNLAKLYKADLREADLRGAKLTCADLTQANLSGADLSRADLRNADLRNADLSGVKGLLDPVAWITQHCETRDDGWIVAYKAVGETIYASPWGEPQPDLEITEECNPCRTVDCGCGVNVATLEWVTANYPNHEIWEILVHPLGAVIPYATDGKFRASRARWSKRVQVCMRGETND